MTKVPNLKGESCAGKQRKSVNITCCMSGEGFTGVEPSAPVPDDTWASDPALHFRGSSPSRGLTGLTFEEPWLGIVCVLAGQCTVRVGRADTDGEADAYPIQTVMDRGQVDPPLQFS